MSPGNRFLIYNNGYVILTTTDIVSQDERIGHMYLLSQLCQKKQFQKYIFFGGKVFV